MPSDRKCFPPFDEKLRTKGQSDSQRQQAHHAIELYYEAVLTDRTAGQSLNPAAPIPYPVQPATAEPPVRPMAADQRSPVMVEAPARTPPAKPTRNTPTAPTHPVSPADSPPVIQENPLVERGRNHPDGGLELRLTGASWVEVYDRLASAVKVRHYSPKTLQPYRHWTRKFQTFTKMGFSPRKTSGAFSAFLPLASEWRRRARIRHSMPCCSCSRMSWRRN